MKNFFQRAVTGLTFAFVMTAAILYNQWTFSAVFFLISLLGLLEFYRLIKSDNIQPQVISGIVIAQTLLVILFSYFFYNIGLSWLLISVPMIATVFIIELYRNKKNPFANIAFTLSGIIYLALPIMLIIIIGLGFSPGGNVAYHGEVIMGCILLLWGSDTGAYMIGSKFGKRKLMERISPHKSWEGFFGGMFTSLLAAWINSNWIEDLLLAEWMIISLIIVIAGTLGDLVESMLKRSINVKDSGTLFPGHGGILDRFDGLLIAIPFVFFYLFLIGKI